MSQKVFLDRKLTKLLYMYQLDIAYKFLNMILQKDCPFKVDSHAPVRARVETFTNVQEILDLART